jgi:nicotinate phosphoribosyltransferase
MMDEYGILTDQYQLTMTNGYLLKGMAEKTAVFDLFFRKAPFGGVYAINYGLNKAINDIANMKFPQESLDYIQEQKIFSDDFIDYLANWKCQLTIRTMDDGRVSYPYEPIMQVEGPLIQCQLIETYLLNCFNFPTLCATKANRMWLTSDKAPILEFGLRRAQGPNGGLSASEAACVGGCLGTSNVLAGKLYNLNISGTHAHSWVMAFETELEAFRAYADVYPDSCVLLIDTYDTLESGMPNAIIVAKELKARGYEMVGIRLDSGDLAYFSRECRKMFDKEGLNYVKVIASNDIDEYIIEDIKHQDGAIDIWGIGTKLATCYDQPALGGVYKLVEIDNDPRIKISSNVEKMTIPCKKQVFRIYDKDDIMTGDIMEPLEKGKLEEDFVYDPLNPLRYYKVSKPERVEELLTLKMDKGKLLEGPKDWKVARKNMEEDITHLSDSSTRLLNPQTYKVSISKTIHDLRTKLIDHFLRKNS